MKAFTNIYGTLIEHRPLLQSCLNVWRVARFEDGELDFVYENKAFKSSKECQTYIDNK
jgi:hypothetical protein